MRRMFKQTNFSQPIIGLLSALLLSGCSGATRIQLESSFPALLTEPREVRAAVIMSPEFSEYIATPNKNMTLKTLCKTILWKTIPYRSCNFQKAFMNYSFLLNEFPFENKNWLSVYFQNMSNSKTRFQILFILKWWSHYCEFLHPFQMCDVVNYFVI